MRRTQDRRSLSYVIGTVSSCRVCQHTKALAIAAFIDNPAKTAAALAAHGGEWVRTLQDLARSGQSPAVAPAEAVAWVPPPPGAPAPKAILYTKKRWIGKPHYVLFHLGIVAYVTWIMYTESVTVAGGGGVG